MIRKMHVNLQLSLIEPSSRRVIKTVRNRRCNSQGTIRLQKECFLFPTVAFNAVLSFSKLFGHIDLPNWKPRTHFLRHGLGFVCLHLNAITVKRFHRGFPFGSINVLLFKLEAQIKKGNERIYLLTIESRQSVFTGWGRAVPKACDWGYASLPKLFL